MRKDNKCLNGQLTPSAAYVVVLHIKEDTLSKMNMASCANADFRLKGKKRVPLSARPLVGGAFISGCEGGKIPHSLTRWAMELFSAVDGHRTEVATPQLFEVCN